MDKIQSEEDRQIIEELISEYSKDPYGIELYLSKLDDISDMDKERMIEIIGRIPSDLRRYRNLTYLNVLFTRYPDFRRQIAQGFIRRSKEEFPVSTEDIQDYIFELGGPLVDSINSLVEAFDNEDIDEFIDSVMWISQKAEANYDSISNTNISGWTGYDRGEFIRDYYLEGAYEGSDWNYKDCEYEVLVDEYSKSKLYKLLYPPYRDEILYPDFIRKMKNAREAFMKHADGEEKELGARSQFYDALEYAAKVLELTFEDYLKERDRVNARDRAENKQ